MLYEIKKTYYTEVVFISDCTLMMFLVSKGGKTVFYFARSNMFLPDRFLNLNGSFYKKSAYMHT